MKETDLGQSDHRSEVQGAPGCVACFAEIPREQLQYDHHPTWATMILVPFLLNYFAGWYVWYRVDKRMKFTWLACFFGLYPQLRALNIIQELWKNPERGLLPRRESLNGKSFRLRSSSGQCPPPSLWTNMTQCQIL